MPFADLIRGGRFRRPGGSRLAMYAAYPGWVNGRWIRHFACKRRCSQSLLAIRPKMLWFDAKKFQGRGANCHEEVVAAAHKW